MRRIFAIAALTLLPAVAQGQSIDDIFGEAIRDNISSALSVYGISAVPSETASTLRLESESDTYDTFLASQLGGGFTLSDSVPLYLEGFIGISRYDPVFLISDGTTDSLLPLKWTTVSATGGIGWEFELTENLSLLPMPQISIGRVQSDSSIAAQIIADGIGLDTSFINGGGATVGGIGGSLTLAYNKRWDSDYEVDFTLRHTHMILRPILGDSDLSGEADAITTGYWSRLRIPTGAQLFNRPVRIVLENSGSVLWGDQGTVMGTDWLAQIGAGGEVDLDETFVPWITTTRLVARYTVGQRLTGFSIGLAASF